MTIKWTMVPTENFGAIAKKWDALNKDCGNLPFFDSLFIAPLLEAFPCNKGALVAMANDERERTIAGIILHPIGLGRWETYQPSQLPLGPFIVRAQFSVQSIGESLASELPGVVVSIGLTQCDPLYVARPDASPKLETLDYIDTAWVDIDSDFETYWSSRGKNLRQNMRKQRNRLEADAKHTTLEVIRAPIEVPEALDHYSHLESGSWKAEEGTAILANNAQGKFYRAMMENFCGAGRGAIYRYKIGNDVAAMDLCIESGTTMVILKTAYNASDKSLSPAFLMREEQFARLFSSHSIKRIEFYGRVMEWHTRWTEKQRTLYHATFYRSALVTSLKSLIKS